MNIGKFVYITLVFIILYAIFMLSYPYSIIIQDVSIIILLIIIIKIIYIHHTYISLTVYRSVIKSIFSENSMIYNILSRGFLIKIFALIGAIIASLKLIITLCLVNAYLEQYIAIYISIIVFFYFYYDNKKYRNINISFLSKDMCSLTNIYLIPFIISVIFTFIITIYDVVIGNIFIANSIADILEKSVDTVNHDYMYPLKVALRHIYALDLSIQQLIQIKFPIGIILYILSIFLFGGISIFFSTMILFISINDKDKI